MLQGVLYLKASIGKHQQLLFLIQYPCAHAAIGRTAQQVFDLAAMIEIASRRGLHHFRRIADRLPTMVKSAYFRMPLFKPGTVVLLESKRETISYIIVRRNLLLVHLVGRETPVHSDELVLEPSLFTLARV